MKAGHRAHSPVKVLRKFPWPVCRWCGLVFLRNKLTEKAIKDGCEP